mgnify:CR=1 FL=1
MYCKNFSIGVRGNDTRPYVSPDVEVIGIELQGCVMVGSEVCTESLTNEDFEW